MEFVRQLLIVLCGIFVLLLAESTVLILAINVFHIHHLTGILVGAIGSATAVWLFTKVIDW